MQWADNFGTACGYLEFQVNCFAIQKLSYIAVSRKETCMAYILHVSKKWREG